MAANEARHGLILRLLPTAIKCTGSCSARARAYNPNLGSGIIPRARAVTVPIPDLPRMDPAGDHPH
jgi:hypothetical protein